MLTISPKVTTVSVTSANGFAGTVANPSTTPAVTLSTSINAPALKGDGTAVAAASTTGSGTTIALATSPVFTTPNIGVATATTINKVTITAPATSATLTIADGRTFAAAGTFGVAYAKYNFAVDGGAVSTITLATNTTIPDNALVVACTLNSTTAFTSGGSATITFGTSAGSSATSLKTSGAYTVYTLDAVVNGTATFAAPFKMTASGSVTMTIGTAALTAGVCEVYILYYVATA